MATLLALDVGTKTIGVARADDRVGLPTPLCTLSRKGVKKDGARLLGICEEQKAVAVIVGMPYELDGGEGRSARLARQIGEEVARVTALPVHYQDERYSTVEASERLRAAGYDSRQQKGRIDQAAAAVILEDWLRRQATEAESAAESSAAESSAAESSAAESAAQRTSNT